MILLYFVAYLCDRFLTLITAVMFHMFLVVNTVGSP